MTSRIKDAGNDNLNLAQSYVTWDSPEGFAKASKTLNQGLQNSQPIQRSTAAIANRFAGIDGITSVRDSMSMLDYNWFRPGEMTGLHFRDIIAQCLGAYQKVPIVKQVIDLMSDFTAQGIRLIHKDPAIQNFYREWFRKVNGPERSERIANILYRAGNVIIKRADARLNPVITSRWKKTIADTDLSLEDDAMPGPYEVPYRYTIINPLIVEVLGEHVAAFTGKVHYVLKLPSTFYNTLSLPLTSFDPSILTQGMPRDLQQAMDRNERYLLLDSDKLVCLFYKKDDWDVWAYPMLYSLLDEITLLQKMKLADMTALDGVISHIRVWKLGSMEHKIFPTNAAITKLSNVLLNHLAGGAMDLVWGPDLELAQTSTDVANFLGSEKYEFCMNTIHTGLGVPAAIGRTKGTMTDNFMSLRVLLERLQYGRSILTQFWDFESRRVQEAMGFKEPALVMYDNIIMNDETAEKALWIQLVDRDIVPVEAVQERFGRIPEIDNLLIKREYEARETGEMAIKVSPYHDAEPDLSLTKIGMQRGVIMPSALPDKFDLDLKKPSKDEQEILDNQFSSPPPPTPAAPTPKKKGVSGQGKPRGAGDKGPRDKRTPKPSAKGQEFIDLVTHAKLMQHAISSIVNPYFLDKFEKTSLAELNPDEGYELTSYKFNLLLNTKADDSPDRETIVNDIMDRPIQSYDEIIKNDYTKLCKSFQDKLERELTVGDLETIQCYIYALLHGVK